MRNKSCKSKRGRMTRHAALRQSGGRPRERRRAMRGFFFTVMALAILSFMLMSVQLWVKTFEQSDIRSSQRFKGEAMRLVLSTLSDKAMSDFANASAFYALHKTVNYSAYEGLVQEQSSDPRNNGTGRVEKTVYELMQNGTSTPGSTTILYSNDEMDAYTLASWQAKIRSAANVMGFNASFSEPQNFSFRQIDAWRVGVYFQVQMDITDLEHTMRQSKTLNANSTFQINGFLDPYITRHDLRQRVPAPAPSSAAQKQIFKDPKYNEPADLAPKLLADQSGADGEGYGWFYGPITNQYPDKLNESILGKLSQYVLMHSWDDDLPMFAGAYGAIIVTDPPIWVDGGTDIFGNCIYNITSQNRCLNCVRRYVPQDPINCRARPDEILDENTTDRPMMVVSGNSIGANWFDSIPWIYRAGMPIPEDKQKFVLIDNQYTLPELKLQGTHRLYDVTALRDSTICGFYLNSSQGPSFFQRTLEFIPSENVHPLGIETFVIGQWAGGKLDQSHDDRSRLDWEFYSNSVPLLQPVRIKSMPGCKYLEMCDIDNKNATTEALGKFKLTPDAISRYNMGAIACDNFNSAPCDE